MDQAKGWKKAQDDATKSLNRTQAVCSGFFHDLKNGRPVSDAPEIFLRAVAPYVSLQNFDNILIKHMRKAGIPLDSIKHHGLHSLRHSLATHMLDEGIPITSIQGVLGHINADSTQKYIGVNVRQLRSCALEVTD